MPEFSSSTYSATDASNTSASPDGAPEGMNPSGVNDTIRALIGATKRFWTRIQTAGGTFGGATDAYTATYSPVLAAYVSGERYSFVANADNTGTATLNINSLGAKTIKKVTSSGKVALAAGDIKSTQPVTVEYDGTDMIMVTPIANAATGTVTSVATGTGLTGGPITTTGTVDLDLTALTAASPATGDYVAGVDVSDSNNEKKFLVSDILALAATSSVPVGTVIDYAGSSEPSGWLFCYGQAISRTTYADLFTALGTTYGSGDGSTTFNLPDLRGRVVAGKDNMGGSTASRITSGGSGITGTTLGASGGAETHTLTTAQLASHTHGPGSGTAFLNVQVGGSLSTTSGGSDWSSSSATASAGSGNAHNNTQPTLILNKIIKT